MRFGVLSSLAVAVSFATFAMAQASDAAVKHHHHHKKACSKACEKACVKGGNIVAVAAKAGTFKELLSQLEAAGLVGVLKGPGPFTVFAPNDQAFAHSRSLDKLSGDKEKLGKILKYHVVKGDYSAEKLQGLRSLTTLEGESLMINAKDGKVIVDGALVTQPDVKASNGVIHVIDSVLVPERGK
ncbi:MAG TPA: fasciclin domain-containing protein [Drouetiella sp.]